MGHHFMWVCSDCDFAVFGDKEDAHVHHHTPGCFGHWMYEVAANEHGMFHDPTGQNIHTSDMGGFYRDEQPVGTRESVEEIFFKMEMNRRAKRLST